MVMRHVEDVLMKPAGSAVATPSTCMVLGKMKFQLLLLLFARLSLPS